MDLNPTHCDAVIAGWYRLFSISRAGLQISFRDCRASDSAILPSMNFGNSERGLLSPLCSIASTDDITAVAADDAVSAVSCVRVAAGKEFLIDDNL